MVISILMESVYVELIGYAAAFFGTTLMFPQVYKTWKTKKTEGVSTLMLFFYFMNCSLWLAYSVLTDVYPLALTNAVGLANSIILIMFKLKYKKNRPPHGFSM